MRLTNKVPYVLVVLFLWLLFKLFTIETNQQTSVPCTATANILKQIESLKKENKELSEKLKRQKSLVKLDKKDILLHNRKLERDSNDLSVTDKRYFEEHVTVMLHKCQGCDPDCFQSQLKNVKSHFPNTIILTDDVSHTLGQAFNTMSKSIKTDYFLFLDSSFTISDPLSDTGVGWLLYVLKNVPELEFIGGSILEGDVLHTPCYRLRLCNWMFSQTYEYKQSLGNVMICEEISSSFMGRTSSLQAIPEKFDQELPTLATTDFFLRAIRKSLKAGALPEVIFKMNKNCQRKELKGQDKLDALFPFALKHKVLQYKDIDGTFTHLCDTSHYSISGKRAQICIEAKTHENFLKGDHWAYSGTFTYPFILNILQDSLAFIDNFLTERGIKYFVYDGVALGALKTRSILPWEAGDVDIDIYGFTKPQILKIFHDELSQKHGFTVQDCGIPESQEVCLFATPQHVGTKMGGILTFFCHPGKPPDDGVRMKVGHILIPFYSTVISDLRKSYGNGYLQHKMYGTDKHIQCTADSDVSHSCLPNFGQLLNGYAGTYREFFCDI